MARIKFVLIACPKGGLRQVPSFNSPYKHCVAFSYLFHSFTLGLYIVLGLVFHKAQF
jgi:hypothetical protein